MTRYFENLRKIEFILTWNCTGKCRHCSQGDHPKDKTFLDPLLGARVVRELAEKHVIETVMTFGGEPLLCPDGVEAIMSAARNAKIPHRQVITNGYFTEDPDRMRRVVQMLAESGCNDLLLSVDAFHQETIPLETVRAFALLAKEARIPLRLQPAWLVRREDDNIYNEKTRSVLDLLQKDGFSVGDGNVIFPEGNASRYLSEYFTDSAPENPYAEDPNDVRTLSVEPDGTLLGQSLYKKGIWEILEAYEP
ncbi:MAG: radical SAM protein [Clostridia bacterium]|nr:radical SAM protein [Clostridia bacterium]